MLSQAAGDLPAAKACYLEAIRLKPDFAIAWNNLAGVFKDEGQIVTAIAYYRLPITISACLLLSHHCLHCIALHRAERRFASALNSLTLTATSATPCASRTISQTRSRATRLQLGETSLTLSLTHSQSLTYSLTHSLTHCFRLRPDFAIAHGNLATCQYDLGEYR